MEKFPNESVDTTGITIRKGYSFRVIPVDDNPKTYKITTTVPKPEVTMAQNPSEKITPITIPLTTKKPVKL
jgi:hypothetical protein